MNAVVTAKKMAQDLTNAGFNVEIKQEENVFSFFATSKNEWFETSYIFSGFVNTYNSRPRKYFSVTRSMPFSKSKAKRNISYADMWNEIQHAIRMMEISNVKVGA
jgi:hypothetical protein